MIPIDLRRLVRRRAAARCEYCFRVEQGLVVPTTAIGRVTVALLRVNWPARVEVREELAALGRWPGPLI